MGEGGDHSSGPHHAEDGRATADRTFPAMNRPISSISIRLRDTFVPRTVISGAPSTTPTRALMPLLYVSLGAHSLQNRRLHSCQRDGASVFTGASGALDWGIGRADRARLA